MQKLIEARINAESKVKIVAGPPKPTPEEAQKILDAKIDAEIKARKEVADAAIAAFREKASAEAAENEARFRRLEDERKAAADVITAEIKAAHDDAKAIRDAAAAKARASNWDDEMWTANMPEHILKGYLAVDDDVMEDQMAEEADDDDEMDQGNDDMAEETRMQ